MAAAEQTFGGFAVRPAVAADVPTIAAFNIAMAAETEGLDLDPETIAAGVEAAVVGGQALYFVAHPTGDPATMAACAMVTTEWSDWRNTGVWWLQSVYTDPPHRRRGAFRALYDAVEAGARAAGAAGLRLYAANGNASGALDVYRRLGMRDDHYRVFQKMF